MWVRFTKDFDFRVPERKGRVVIAYKAGTVANVTRVCAALALDAGAAESTKSPRGKANDDVG